MEKKLVLPGDHLSSAEESETGQNTYTENDEVYAATAGEDASVPGTAEVKTKGRSITLPYVGMPVYCMIIKAGMNKAIGGCMPVDEAEGGKSGVSFDAVLPVTAIKNAYVREIRDEVRVGDIIKAKIQKIDKSGFDITMKPHDCGVIACFCPRCRIQMAKKEANLFICGSCGWKDRKKLPLAEGEEPPPEEQRERRGGFGRGGFGRGPRREGGRRGPPRRGGGHFGRKPGPGGRSGSY
ncbi:MAG: exosome complex RNA-binding protein Csl4 [Candidatus Micrarchaeota archaeon]